MLKLNTLHESSTHQLSSTNGSPTTLSGLFAIVGEINQNGRIYPEKVYADAIAEIMPKIRSRSLLGETDHPADRDEVFLKDVSHVITECHVGKSKSGKTAYYGTVELLDTPAGKIVQSLVKAGIPIGISSRGIGSIKETSSGSEVTQLKLITFDLVADPSFKSAILSEDAKSELSENLKSIESKLPMNESTRSDSTRSMIKRIRESFRLNEQSTKSPDIQTMEIKTLRELLKSKTSQLNSMRSIISECERQLKSSSKKINDLESSLLESKSALKDMKSRYTKISENHGKLQDAYNLLEETNKSDMKREISKRDNKILDLQKRLAVEKRGMSYSQVSELLEGVQSVDGIDSRLDSVTSMNRRSNSINETRVKDLKESLLDSKPKGSNLAKLISRV